jgi:ribosomal protein L7Ae-like RNA K-turn-binding protein
LNTEKVKSLLGLAKKGRMSEIGKMAVSVLIKRKRASLVILAADASEKLKKEIEFQCRRNNVPIYIFSDKSELGELNNRNIVAVIGISDPHLADGIKKALSL